MAAPAAGRVKVHWVAMTGFVLSLVALVLAFYGSLYAEKHIAGSPLRQARGSAGLPAEPVSWFDRLWVNGETTVFGDRFDRTMLALTERSKIANYSLQVVAFVVPFVLGIGSAVIGGRALAAIERSRGRRSGNFLAVVSIMVGGFAAVISGCMLVSFYVWPMMPSLYTQ